MLHHSLRAFRALGVFAIPAIVGLAAAALLLLLGFVVLGAIGVVGFIVLSRLCASPKPERKGAQTIIPPQRVSRPRWRPFRSEPVGLFSHER